MKDTVLFFTYWYPNANNPGRGLFVKRHAKAIASQKAILILAVHIVKANTLFKKKMEIVADENAIETHSLYLFSYFNKLLYVLLPLHYFLLKKHISRIILQKNNIKIIHSNVLFPASIVAFWLSVHFKFKLVITEHWSKIDKFFKVSLYKRSGKKALNHASAISVVSEELGTTLKKYCTNSNVNVVPNVVDSKTFEYKSWIEKNSIYTFIAVAHWHAPKNPFYFLEALQQLTTSGELKGFKMVLIGTGPQIKIIKQKAYTFSIEYKDGLSAKDLAIELNKAQVFLHGSDYETFSVVIAEALCCGLPCVVSPVGIANEVIQVQNGFIANNSIEDWKQKILKCVITDYKGDVISNQLKQKYSEESVGKAFLKLYSQINS